jgi:hypothetical protein
VENANQDVYQSLPCKGPGAQSAPAVFASFPQLPHTKVGFLLNLSTSAVFPPALSSHMCILWFSGFLHKLSTIGNRSLISCSFFKAHGFALRNSLYTAFFL